MLPAGPRHFMPSSARRGVGLPSDRSAQMAARRAFVTLKLLFLQAVSDLPGTEGDWLRHQVRATEDPSALWLLRGPVLAALAGDDPEYRARRLLLRRGLATLFPEGDPASEYVPF